MHTLEQTQQFSFQSQELIEKLLISSSLFSHGYWQLSFSRLAARKRETIGYLGITKAETISYSGYQPWGGRELLQVTQRYILQTRHQTFKPHIARWQAGLQQQSITAQAIAEHMFQLGITPSQLQEALRLRLLNDFDGFLKLGAGEACFMPDAQLQKQLPVSGFSLPELLNEVLQRQFLWQKLQPLIPSMNMLPVLNEEAIKVSNLPDAQRQWIEKVVQQQRPLHQIAVGLAKDSLEVARLFGQWIRAKLVYLESPQQDSSSTVMIIDDSPLVLKQFQSLVGALGYPVQVCQQAEMAVQSIAQIKPAIVFIDINMPGITGFELVKQIRQQAELAAIPLVILTGEQKLSNKWRAQWSGCEFLTKPLASTEINQFQLQVQELIESLVFGLSLAAGA
ncbi:MAG: response regulator [Acaryochloris sp. RU_4_1]|nr:response regulator [Acaryochloris sp. RU_4_1]NJR53545.1 response regulator [Acaryochloris sp. CRU_2_0]